MAWEYGLKFSGKAHHLDETLHLIMLQRKLGRALQTSGRDVDAPPQLPVVPFAHC